MKSVRSQVIGRQVPLSTPASETPRPRLTGQELRKRAIGGRDRPGVGTSTICIRYQTPRRLFSKDMKISGEGLLCS